MTQPPIWGSAGILLGTITTVATVVYAGSCPYPVGFVPHVIHSVHVHGGLPFLGFQEMILRLLQVAIRFQLLKPESRPLPGWLSSPLPLKALSRTLTLPRWRCVSLNRSLWYLASMRIMSSYILPFLYMVMAKSGSSTVMYSLGKVWC